MCCVGIKQAVIITGRWKTLRVKAAVWTDKPRPVGIISYKSDAESNAKRPLKQPSWTSTALLLRTKMPNQSMLLLTQPTQGTGSREEVCCNPAESQHPPFYSTFKS